MCFSIWNVTFNLQCEFQSEMWISIWDLNFKSQFQLKSISLWSLNFSLKSEFQLEVWISVWSLNLHLQIENENVVDFATKFQTFQTLLRYFYEIQTLWNIVQKIFVLFSDFWPSKMPNKSAFQASYFCRAKSENNCKCKLSNWWKS